MKMIKPENLKSWKKPMYKKDGTIPANAPKTRYDLGDINTQLWFLQYNREGHDVNLFAAVFDKAWEQSDCELQKKLGVVCLDNVEMKSVYTPLKLSSDKVYKHIYSPDVDKELTYRFEVESLCGDKFYLDWQQAKHSEPYAVYLRENKGEEYEEGYWCDVEEGTEFLPFALDCLSAVQEFLVDYIA
jgi:hypothetical protein